MPSSERSWTPPRPEPRWLASDRRPDGVGDGVVEAMGTLGEAVEWMERARGHLYEFHQMCGRVDLLLGDAADQLRDTGEPELAGALDAHLVGRNVLEGRWSFQVIEEYEAVYWEAVRSFARHAEEQLLDGWRHVYESEMKDRRRTDGDPYHRRRPSPGT